MKTILVDDMLLDLQLFELKCADMPDFEIVGKFTCLLYHQCTKYTMQLMCIGKQMVMEKYGP